MVRWITNSIIKEKKHTIDKSRGTQSSEWPRGIQGSYKHEYLKLLEATGGSQGKLSFTRPLGCVYIRRVDVRNRIVACRRVCVIWAVKCIYGYIRSLTVRSWLNFELVSDITDMFVWHFVAWMMNQACVNSVILYFSYMHGTGPCYFIVSLTVTSCLRIRGRFLDNGQHKNKSSLGYRLNPKIHKPKWNFRQIGVNGLSSISWGQHP